MIPNDLVSALKDRRVILFVGAGVSMNLGVPSSRDIRDHIGQTLGLPANAFQNLNDYQTLAEYYELTNGGSHDLYAWLDAACHPESIDISRSQIHRHIVDLDCPIIYTTNYDCWIEEAHKARGKTSARIATVGDLAEPHHGETEIVKFHGDFNNEGSLVLTESHYFNRLSFETPLDIKLRSDSLARPLLFIGYSLSDPNMRYLLYKLERLWDGSPDKHQRPKSYISLSSPDVVQEKVLEARGVIPIVWKNDDPGEALAQFLAHLVKAIGPGNNSPNPASYATQGRTC